MVPDPAELNFTPLFLVSASQPNARHRQSCSTGNFCFIVSQGLALCIGGHPSCLLILDLPNTEMSCASAAQNSRAFMYVAGAGDDEESWARGLTPKLFWQHHKAHLLLLFACHLL